MSNLLEKTGHSFSGISDVIHEEDKAEELLQLISDDYYQAVYNQEQFEKLLEEAKERRSILVSDFVFAMGKEELVFNQDGWIVVIKLLSYEERRIDIERYELTAFESKVKI